MAALVALLAALAGAAPFVPPAHREGGRTVVPLVFTDGTRAELRYPPRLRIARMGVEPYGSGVLDSRVDRDFVIRRGTVADVMAERDGVLLRTYPGGVGLWETLPGDAHVRDLGFQFGGWAVLVHDYPPEFDGGAASMTEDHRAAWAAGLRGRETRRGFLRLRGSRRLRLAAAGDHAGPQLTFGGLGGRLTLIPGPCRRTRDHDRLMSGRWVSWNRTFASWCVSPAMRADIHAGGGRWMRSAIRHVDVRRHIRPTAMRTCVRAMGRSNRGDRRAGSPARARPDGGGPPLRRAGGARHAVPRDP